MYHIKEMPTYIAERVKITLGPEELLKIDNDDLLRSVVVDAAGRESAVLLQQIQDKHVDYFDLLDGQDNQDDMKLIFNAILKKALADSTITESITILKKEQKFLREQAEVRQST